MPKLKLMLQEKRQVLHDHPGKARVEVTADSSLVRGFESRVKVRDFEIVVDQPAAFGGADRGPRPSEYVLAALAACHEVTYRLYADALDIPLDDVSVSVTGVSDARGFLSPGEDIRPGFQEIRGVIRIKSGASHEQIEELRKMVNDHCPVLDDLRTPIAVHMELERE
ncbi:MAG: OsmC family protein [Gammaproteobacteria bacterium]|nr:OsmC family protein [Gammaproteobacteria bacterium]